jgi:hypothetical protein
VFNDKECPDDDLWPCKEASSLAPLALFSAPTGAPVGSAARLQWSAPDWRSDGLTPTPLATSPIVPERDVPAEQVQPVHGRQAEAEGGGGGGGAEAGDRSAGSSGDGGDTTGGSDGGESGGGSRDGGGGAGNVVGYQVLLAARAESCADACSRAGLRCSLRALRELNSCDALRRHFACPSGCGDSIGGERPACI